MFKNPLKYQQGGQTPTQEQQKLLAAFIQWLPKRVKEFQGMQPEQIAQALDGMSKTDEGKKQLQQLMMQFQQEMQGGSQAFRQGGKIHDFICKHAKGGKAGCGCKEDGGEIEKHQDANGKVGVTNGRYQSSDWENEFDQFTPTPGGGYARNYRIPIFGGHRWGIPSNTLRQILITYDENGTPRKAVRDLEGYYGNGQIDTVIYDARGNTRNSPEFEARVNRELEGMDPHQRPTKKEKCGGKVKKGQRGINNLYESNQINSIKETPNRNQSSNVYINNTPNIPDRFITTPNISNGKQIIGYTRDLPSAIVVDQMPGKQFNGYPNTKSFEEYTHDPRFRTFDIPRPLNNRVVGPGEYERGGKVEKAQGGKKVNNNRKTITQVGRGLDEYDAKEMGIDPNTLAGTSSIITAYPNKKPYVVNGQVPFWTRNGLVFNLGAVESGYIEDGTRMSKGVPGRKYKVSSVLDQDGLLNFSYNENAKEFPMISRFASPKDTIYYLDFNDFDKNTLGYEEVRSMYNKAIDQPDTFALNKEAYLELQRQRQERASKKENGGKIK